MTHKPHLAFTLVELLIGMALTVLVGGILYLLQSTGMSQVTKGTIQLSLQSDIRRKIERITTDLRGAYEVLEISPNSIKISQFRTSKEKDDPTEIDHYTVAYTLEKTDKGSVIFRSEDNQQPIELLSADHIDPEIFLPFYYVPPGPKEDYPRFEAFDTTINDSGQRKQICFIRIRLKCRRAKEYVVVATAITLRPALQRMRQPAWKFR